MAAPPWRRAARVHDIAARAGPGEGCRPRETPAVVIGNGVIDRRRRSRSISELWRLRHARDGTCARLLDDGGAAACGRAGALAARVAADRLHQAQRGPGRDHPRGPPRDGIPAIDAPEFVPVAEASLPEDEPVLGLVINGDARAYPLRILIWHEIVNDVVGGVPVAITYAPLCNTALVFDRRVGEEVLEFGSTGKLRHSGLVMYDRTTESWWQQFLGKAIVGELTGTEIAMLPARLELFATLQAAGAGGPGAGAAQRCARVWHEPLRGLRQRARALSLSGHAAQGSRPARPRGAGGRRSLEPRSGAPEGAVRGRRSALYLGARPSLGPRYRHDRRWQGRRQHPGRAQGRATAGRMPCTRSTSRSPSMPSSPMA